MYRVPKSLVVLLLIMSSISITLRAHGGTSLANMVIKGPTFQYVLRKDHDPIVCKHIMQVFNDKFTHLFDAHLLIDSTFSANSIYAFPRLPGVQHSARSTAEMALSAQPTSPEFSTIHWNEGRATPGGCPVGQKCVVEEPSPILVGYFDFDNDGSVDTVIKGGSTFFSSYPNMAKTHEFLIVWRGQRLKISGIANEWDLAHPADRVRTPIIIYGTYLRPFIYRGITYVASYGADGDKEVMAIDKYSFTGRTDAVTGRPQWSGDAVCDLEMKRLAN
ncbi:hypothetical protein [Rhodanobacter sp. C06]|uniref:hypothetical protein n=1 Tax=Rhodanobacter sp. C06 TaxID=1945854 RepID=UPI0011157003|nr:hypothetical protein [Rhodanobacter sp. C06]